MRTTRRSFMSSVAATSALAAMCRAEAEAEAQTKNDASTAELEVRDLDLPGDRSLGRRMTLALPRKQGLAKAPLLVLLHGLGETGDQRLGAFAWLERYGLASAYARLSSPPVVRTSKRIDFTDEHLASVNAELALTPFAGFVIACPYTPNINKTANPTLALEGYAQWIVDVVIPRARAEAAIADASALIALDGCSLGGFVALEVFLRKPETFGALGIVQAAIGAYRAPSYAARIGKAIAAVGGRDLHLETSRLDPFREANVALSVELDRAHIPHELVTLPGPHDQPFLREVGTLEMLRWHDRRFRKHTKKPVP